tara:strand:+ start:487 stop:810 length:324 start_codon:yes stop_codon:yes gene_type:complete
MTENNNQLDFKLLEDLIFKLEIKEAVENGELGEINFCLKHILKFITTSSQIQQGLMKKETERLKDTDKLIQINDKLLESLIRNDTKYNEVIIKLVERVNALEESKND